MHNELDQIKIPSKTFLMGEYVVLFGGSSLVLTHSPYFSIVNEPPVEPFHPESPAGRFLTEKNVKQSFTFLDPHKGVGGFGGSTAEYIASYKSVKSDVELNTEEILRTYFKYFKENKNPPSGADLCAQSLLTPGVVEYKKSLDSTCSFERQDWPFKELGLILFKTKDKVKTHDHLSDISTENLELLKEISEEAIKAFKKGDQEGFLNGTNEFTKEQAIQELLHLDTMALICQVNQIKGVYTSRGCGAMGADVLTVFVKPELRDYVQDQVLELDMGLKFVFKL